MKKITFVLVSIIAYGIYAQATNGNDLFTIFWSFVQSIGG